MGRPRQVPIGWIPTNQFPEPVDVPRKGRKRKTRGNATGTFEEYLDLFVFHVREFAMEELRASGRMSKERASYYRREFGIQMDDVRSSYCNIEHLKSRIRKAVEDNTKDIPRERQVYVTWALNVICPPMTMAEKDAAVQARARNITSRIKEPVIVTELQVCRAIGSLDNFDSGRPMEFAKAFVWLQLTSGCRKIELLDSRVASFRESKVEDFEDPKLALEEKRPSCYILQIGTAKQKRNARRSPQEHFLKFLPAGIHPAVWLGVLRAFRFQVGDTSAMSSVELGARYARRFEAETRRAFYWVDATHGESKQPHKIGTHFNRAVYAQLCALGESRLPGQTESVASIVKSALCHTGRENSRFYESVRVIADDNKDDAKRIAKVLKDQQGSDKQRIKDSDGMVSIDGQTFVKFRKQWRTERMKRIDVQRAEQMLIDANVKPTFANIKSLGLCSTTITRFHDKSLTS